MNPFMRTFTSPSLNCWHDANMAPDGSIFAIPRIDWVATLALAMRRSEMPRSEIWCHDLMAHPDSWALRGALNIAAAYAPDGTVTRERWV